MRRVRRNRQRPFAQPVLHSAGQTSSMPRRGRLLNLASLHWRIMRESLQRLGATPLPTVLSCLTIGVALALPTGLYIVLVNLETLGRSWERSVGVSAFLHLHVDESDGRELARRVAEWSEVGEVEWRSAEASLEEFRTWSGFDDILEGLGQNPLPAVLSIQPKEAFPSAERIAALREALAALPAVEEARVDLEWAERLRELTQLGSRLAAALGLLLMLGVLVVVYNAIRSAIAARRLEIIVLQLVGGSPAFVRRPFLYSGLWYGLGGGLCAWLVVQANLAWLRAPVERLVDLYDSQFTLSGFGWYPSLLLFAIAASLGLLGAGFAVMRQVGHIGSESEDEANF